MVEICGKAIKLVDSLNYMPMALSKIPKTLGLSTGLKKGDFPHLFNDWGNMGRVFERHPDLKYYMADKKGEKEREKLITWYESVKDEIFDFDKEIKEYCRMDVDILTKGVLEFRRLFMEITEGIGGDDIAIDPFSCLTIASVCSTIFRAKFLNEQEIEIPKTCKDRHSKKAMQWLTSFNLPNMRHARSTGGEARIGNLT